MQRLLLTASSLLIVVCLVACGGSSGRSSGTDKANDVLLPAHKAPISRAEFGDDWPFTGDSGVLEAVPGTVAIVFHANEKTYEVNGIWAA